MARMSIYIPDELKERMDMRGDIKWSATAQRAFELELQSTDTGDGSMEATIERLRASKQKGEAETRPDLIAQGEYWAMTKAEYHELERVSGIDVGVYDGVEYPDARLMREIIAKIRDENDVSTDDARDLATNLFDGPILPKGYSQWCYWLEGVQGVWNEVKDEI